MDTPEGRVRLEAYEEKVDQAIADQIEASDKREEPQPRPPSEDHGAEAMEREPRLFEARPSTGDATFIAPSRSQYPEPETGLELDSEPDQDEDNEEIAEENHDEEDADMGVVGEDESEEETVGIIHEDAEDVVSYILFNQLGQAGRSHRREFLQSYRKLVSEIYSPPRITEEIKKGDTASLRVDSPST